MGTDSGFLPCPGTEAFCTTHSQRNNCMGLEHVLIADILIVLPKECLSLY